MPTTNILTNEEMFRPFLPIINIRRVTLETQPDPSIASDLSNVQDMERLYDRNPHIDASGPSPTINNLGQRATATQSSRLAAEQRRGGAFEPKTRVVLDLSVSVSQGNSPKLLLDAIKRALRINVLQVTAEQYTSAMRSSASELATMTGITVQSAPLTNILPYSPGHPLTKQSMEANQFSETLPDGRKVITYPARFTWPGGLFESDLHSLGFIVYSNFDMAAYLGMLSPIQPGLTTAGIAWDLASQRSGLLVIDNGKVVSRSQIFRDFRGNVWEGPVHYEMMFPSNLESKILFLENLDLTMYPKLTESARQKKITNLQNIRSQIGPAASKGFWMTGASPEITKSSPEKPHLWGVQQIVIEESILLPRVQDFRSYNEVENLEFSFAEIENTALASLKPNLRNSKIDIATHESYFSELLLSRDTCDQARFFFSVDWQRMLIENSLFGRLFENRSSILLNKLLNANNITSLKIYRHRVEGSGEAGSTPFHIPKPPNTIPTYLRPKPFEENQIDAILFDTNDILDASRGERLKTVLQDPQRCSVAGGTGGGTSVGITQPNAITEISSEKLGLMIFPNSNISTANLGPTSLRNFEGIDGGIVSKTDGYYQYRIEFDVLDKSIDILSELQDKLGVYIKGIERYYKEATKIMRTPNTGIAPDGSIYLEGSFGTRTETIYIPSELQFGNFNSKTNYFLKEFAELYAPVGGSGVGVLVSTAPAGSPLAGISLADAIDDPSFGFLEILKFFTKPDPNRPVNWSNIQTTLKNYLNPWCATPSSINALILLMEMVSNHLGSIVGVVRRRERQSGFDNDGNITFYGFPQESVSHVSTPVRTFKISHTPKDIFNANLQSNLGFDFLETTLRGQSQQGLNNVTLADFHQLSLEQYTRIYHQFANPNTPHNIVPAGGVHGTHMGENIDLGNVLGEYFSPTFIKTPAGNVSLNTTAIPDSSFLKPVPYALYGNRSNEQFLSQLPVGLSSRTITGFGGSTGNDRIFANDLSTFFSNYHSTDIVTPDWGGPTGQFMQVEQQFPRGVSRNSDYQTEGFGDKYYKLLRRQAMKERNAAYEILFDCLKEADFPPQMRNQIIEREPSTSPSDVRVGGLQYSDFDLSNPNSEASLALEAAINLRNGMGGAPDFATETELLKNAPPQIKALLFQSRLDGQGRPALHVWTQQFFDTVDKNVTVYPEFLYRTQFINKMEYLSGFEVGIVKTPYNPRQTLGTLAQRTLGLPTNIKTQILMKKPRWESTSLTANSSFTSISNAIGDRTPVCRSKSYINSLWLLERNKNYDLPTYDEYYKVIVPPLTFAVTADNLPIQSLSSADLTLSRNFSDNLNVSSADATFSKNFSTTNLNVSSVSMDRTLKLAANKIEPFSRESGIPGGKK